MPNYRGIDGFPSKTGIVMSTFYDISPHQRDRDRGVNVKIS